MSDHEHEQPTFTLGSVVPIIIFLILQTGGAVWWASSIHQNVDNLVDLVESNKQDLDEENLRQWARINSVEDSAANTNAKVDQVNVVVNGIREDLTELRFDIRQNNDLIRQLLSEGVIGR